MSEKSFAKELKQISLNSLGWGLKTFRQDLDALPPEAFEKKFGGKARTVADYVYEVNLVNDHIRLTITNQDLFPFSEGWLYAPEGQRSKEEVIGAFDQSSEKFVEAINGFTEDQMLEPIKSDDEETTRAERCRFVCWHLAYHSGQINYVQTLLGDDGWHWT